jgi:hypothetical protein
MGDVARENMAHWAQVERALDWYAPPKPRAVMMQGGLRRVSVNPEDLYFFWMAARRERPFEYTDYV